MIDLCDSIIVKCKDDYYHDNQRQILEEIIRNLFQKINDQEYQRRILFRLKDYEDVKIFIETIINNLENIQ